MPASRSKKVRTGRADGGNWTSKTLRRSPSPDTSAMKRVRSALEARNRWSCVIARGTLTEKRKPEGV
jgi:hypothetical protein